MNAETDFVSHSKVAKKRPNATCVVVRPMRERRALNVYFFIAGKSVQEPCAIFAERRVRVDGLADIDRDAAHLDGQRHFADQVASRGAADGAADGEDVRHVGARLLVDRDETAPGCQ